MTRKAVKTSFLLLVVLPFAFALLKIKTQPTTNLQSRLATIESLIERDTFLIDQSRYVGTIDKARLPDGHFVSEKPPLLAVIGAGVYGVLYHGFGVSFQTHEALVIGVLSFFFGWLPLFLGFIFYWKLSKQIYTREKLFWISVSCFTLGYLGMGYGTGMNNHVPAATCLLAGFWLAFQMIRNPRKQKHAWMMGVCLALAPTLDLPSLFVSSAIMAYVWVGLGSRRFQKTFLNVCVGALPVLALHFWLNHQATGFWLPLYFREDLIFYPGSYWDHPSPLDRMQDSRLVFLLQILVGFRGLFSHTPILIFFALLAWRALTQKRLTWKREILLAAGSLIVLVLFYTLQSPNKYGGTCIGFRFLVLLMPLLLLWVAQWFHPKRSRHAWMAFGVAMFVSFYLTLGTIIQPWRNGEIEKVMRGIGLVHFPE